MEVSFSKVHGTKGLPDEVEPTWSAVVLLGLGRVTCVAEEAAILASCYCLFSSWLIFLDGKLNLVEFDFFLHPLVETG